VGTGAASDKQLRTRAGKPTEDANRGQAQAVESKSEPEAEDQPEEEEEEEEEEKEEEKQQVVKKKKSKKESKEEKPTVGHYALYWWQLSDDASGGDDDGDDDGDDSEGDCQMAPKKMASEEMAKPFLVLSKVIVLCQPSGVFVLTVCSLVFVVCRSYGSQTRRSL
jgi:hypothetical protein